jgi:hypothetical protein
MRFSESIIRVSRLDAVPERDMNMAVHGLISPYKGRYQCFAGFSRNCVIYPVGDGASKRTDTTPVDQYPVCTVRTFRVVK